MHYAIEVKNITKCFFSENKIFSSSNNDRITAVDHVTFTIKQGELFGILGENGAGKTTLINIFSTLIIPDSGTVVINGFDIHGEEKKIRNSIGLVRGDDRSFYGRLTGRQNVEFFAAFMDLPPRQIARRIKELSVILSMDSFLDKKYYSYSAGMKQRLNIARGLVHSPKVLLFDEPTKSLDPKSSKEIRKFLRTLADRGYAIVLVTHNLDEAEEICDRAGVMDKGRLHIMGSMDNIRTVF